MKVGYMVKHRLTKTRGKIEDIYICELTGKTCFVVGNTSGPVDEWIALGKKCITLGCDNHRNEGEFKGDLCAHCHEYIMTGQFDKLPKRPSFRLETDGSTEGTKVFLDGKSIPHKITNFAQSYNIYDPTTFTINISVVGNLKTLV